MEEKYKKGKGNAGLDGVQFQINLLVVFLLNAINNLKEWRISTENENAAKFDDIAMELADGSAVLLQAKFKQSRKITKRQLMSTNSNKKDFSLPKYFFSYHEVKAKYAPVTVIVCTNTGVDEKDLEHVISSDYIPPDSMLYYEGSRSGLFQFNENLIPILKTKAKNYLNMNLKGTRFDKSIITDDNLREFLKNFQLICNYPAGPQINTIIDKALRRFSGNVSSHEIYKKMEDWFRQPRGEYLTQARANAMFCEIRSEKYCEVLREHHVSFRRNNFSISTRKKIIYVPTGGGNILQLLKIYHALKDDGHVKLYANPNDGFEVQKQTIDAFKLPKYSLLILSWHTAPDETIMTEICDALQKYEYKKIILVTKNANPSLLGDSVLIADGSVTFQDLSDETRKKFVKMKNVIFQGETSSLEELLLPFEYEKVTSSLLLKALVKGEKIKLGIKLLGLNEEKERYYIDRTFERPVQSKKEIITENDLFDVNEKVVLIADSAGMGKSTVLAKIGTHIKEKYRHFWVVRIELNACTKLLRDCLRNKRDTIQLTELLHGTELTSDLEKDVFSMKEKVVVLLDGLDEICPDYTGLIVNLISQCRDAANIGKIIVTTRPHMMKELEEVVEVTPYMLQPFTKPNQINFLTKYWTHNLQLTKDGDRSRCQKFAEALIYKMSLWTSEYGDYKFSAVPLQVKMLAEIFQESVQSDDTMSWHGCKEFLMMYGSDPIFPENMNITNLYEMFVEKKRDVFIDKGNPTGNPAANIPLLKLFNECLSYHRSVAVEVVLGKSKYNLTSCYSDPSKEADVLKIGIIHRWDNKLRFIHITFAEYFLAEFLILEVLNNRRAEFLRFFFDELLLKHRFNVVRTFLEHFLQKAQDALTYKHFKHYTSITYKRGLNYLDYSSLLFVPIKEGRIFLLQFILNCIDFKITNNNEIDVMDYQRSYLKKSKVARYFKKCKCGNTLKFLHGLTTRAGINLKDGFGRTPLHYAVREGYLGMVKFLLEHGANVDSRNGAGYTALHLQRGSLDIVKLLVKWGANLNIKNGHGDAIIHLATRAGWLDILRFLLQQGLAIDMQNDSCDTALHFAVESGNFDVVKFLTENGASVNVQNSCGWTPMHLATTEGHLEIIRLLVENGSKLSIKNGNGDTSMHLASRMGNFEMARIFVENRARVDIQNSDGNTPMHLAAEAGNFELLKLLVGNGTGVNIQNADGNSPMHLTVEKGKLDMVKLLVARRADVNVKNYQGWLPIHLAVHMGEMEIVKFLLQQGPEIYTKNPCGDTLLHGFAEKGQLETVQILIKLGAKDDLGQRSDINTKNPCGDTLLHVFADKGQLEMVQTLINLGAKVDRKNVEGNTALHLACRGSKFDCMEFLLQWGADPNTRNNSDIAPICSAVQMGDSDNVRLLFAYGADLNIICKGYHILLLYGVEFLVDTNLNDSYSWSPIHLATVRADLNAVTLLVNLGADIDFKDAFGNSALHMAAKMNSADIVRYLVESGADVNSTNKFGFTPIQLAAKSANFNMVRLFIKLGTDINNKICGHGTLLQMFAASGDLSVVELLIDLGANVDIPDDGGNTALHLAVKAGHFSIVKLLVERRTDINIRNGKGCAPMHIAAENGAMEIVNFFMEQGADVNIRDSDGNTPLHLLSRRRKLFLMTRFRNWLLTCIK